MKRLYRDSRGMLWFLFYFVASTTVLFYSFRAIENYYKNPPLDPTDVPLLAWLPMVFICVGWWEIGVWFMRKVMGNEASTRRIRPRGE